VRSSAIFVIGIKHTPMILYFGVDRPGREAITPARTLVIGQARDDVLAAFSDEPGIRK
jgi:hypothetical protein